MSKQRLVAFISSKMEELWPERQIIKTALEKLHIDTFVFEYDAGARAVSIQHTYLREVEEADLYIGVFWKGYGERTIEEFDRARTIGKDCLVYEKQLDIDGLRDPRLAAFLDTLGDVELGLTMHRFGNGEELARFVKSDVAAWTARVIRDRRSSEETPSTSSSGQPNGDSVAIAADDLLRGWYKRFMINDNLGVLELDLATPSKRGSEGCAHVLSRTEVIDRLASGERLVLEAGPGAGKSITLLQIAGAV